MKKIALVILAFLINLPGAEAGNWPAWRGPYGNGTADESNIPINWSVTENIRWKTPLPAPGNSTPIVWGNRIFVSGALDKGKRRTLMCFDRANGDQLWVREVGHEKAEVTHKTNPYCASSPVTDGKNVYVWHGSAGFYAYDFAGKKLWEKDLGDFQHQWGNASSPVLYKKLVILSCGPGKNSYLIAMNKTTGDQVWRQDPPTAVFNKIGDFHGSWSTPILINEAGRTRLVVTLPEQVSAFDPGTGKEIWFCKGMSKLAYTDPHYSQGKIVAMSGYHGPALAVKTGGLGDVTATHRLWLTETKNPQRIGSGVIVGDHLYILQDGGIAWCIDVNTGEATWKKRLGGNCWTSMSFVDGRLYVINEDGRTFVLNADPTVCDVIATNDLDELTRGSLVFSDGQVFVRTYEHLYCIENAKK